jgi:two-component system sensor kinase FixL
MKPSQQVRELSTTVPGATTDELLHKLLANITALLGARRAYVTEIIACGKSRTIASWEDNQRGPVREYAISGTPCAAVIRDGVQVIDCELGSRYVLGEKSLGYGCESFVGSPIVDRDGTRIGQLCVFGTARLADPEMAGALVSLAAVRVSAELEHRQQQTLLREQQQKLETLLGNLPGMAYRCDYNKARTLRVVSQGCRTLTGFSSEQLVGDQVHWAELMHESDRERVWDEVQAALEAGRNYEVQYRILAKDGTQKWVWERGCGLPDDDGEIRSLEGFVSDATELRESEVALARSQAYSTAIVATAAEGIITLDAGGRLESFNRAAEEMFGYKASEVLGQDVSLLMPDCYRSAHTGYIERYTTTGEGSIFGKGREVPARRKDGSIFPIYLAASEILVDGDRCFAGILRDISEQKAAEESLKATERRFRAVFDQRLQLVRILSTDGIVLEANQKSLDFAGLQRDGVIGRYLWDTPWWSHSPELQQRLRDAVSSAAKGAAVQFEATCPRPNGNMATLDFSLRPITDNAGQVAFLVTESHDITEQKLAEEEARHHRERIAHVSRLSTLGEMAAGIAHEINQPLTAISLFAQAGRRLVEAGNFEKMGDVCYKLNEHALRASDVVERMQTMARQGESVKETVDCNDLIESAVRLAESEARIYDIQVEFEKGKDLPPVSVDGVQIQQVALNLLRNAMEAMLAANCCKEKSVAIRTRAHEENEIEVTVTDCGFGVPQNSVAKLFTPFSTTKKSGMGMGLSISQAIVRAHGGRIDFRNNEAGGATFWFTLPAAKREIQDGQ